MIETYVFYSCLLIGCFLLSNKAQKSGQFKYLFVLALILSFVSGLRSIEVGIDTVNYVEKFQYIEKGKLEYAWGLEEGFKIICFVLLKIFHSHTAIFIVLALLTNLLIFLRFWDFKDISNIPCMVCCYYISFYFMTMNVMRQFCAIAIIFYFTRELNKKKYWKFIIITIMASMCFHQSALIGLIYLALDIFKWRELSNKQRKFMLICAFFFPVMLGYVLKKTMKYEHYLGLLNINIGYMIGIKIIAIIVTMLLINNFIIHIRKKSNVVNKNMSSLVPVYYSLGLLISSGGYFFSFIDRIGWYLYIYEGIFWGMCLKNKKYKILILIEIIILFIYIYISNLKSGSQGVIPYKFMWQ